MSIIFSPTPSIRSLSAMPVRIPQMLRLQSTTEKRLRTSSFTVLFPVRRLPRTAKHWEVQIGLFKADETEFTKENALMTATSENDGSFSLTKYRMETGL